jgi:elongation factor Ts
VKDIAMHIAAAHPVYVKSEDIPQEFIEKEKNIYAAQITNKPANIIDKIVQGKLEKFYEETCLLDQIFVKDPEQKKKIKDLLVENIAQLGENIIMKRFVRFQLGEKPSS